jgi:hypothetical protein
MQTGTQLCAFEGFETLKKGRVYAPAARRRLAQLNDISSGRSVNT